MTAISESRALRAARNQSLFREVNERIKALNEEFARILPMGDWICECADDACFETMSLTIDEYEAIRSNPARFPVVPRHELPDVEQVVEEHERYVVVEKIGDAGEIAIKLDPRRPHPDEPPDGDVTGIGS